MRFAEKFSAVALTCALTACGAPESPELPDGGESPELDSGTVVDDGGAVSDAGARFAPGTYCIQAGPTTSCFGGTGQLLTPLDGGYVLGGSTAGFSATVFFAKPAGSGAHSYDLRWTERTCAQQSCPIACRYTVAAAGDVRVLATKELDALFSADAGEITTNADGGCVSKPFKGWFRIMTP